MLEAFARAAAAVELYFRDGRPQLLRDSRVGEAFLMSYGTPVPRTSSGGGADIRHAKPVKWQMRAKELRPVFELTGGSLALDLASTKDRRPTAKPVEHLHGYDDLACWGAQAHAISTFEEARLRGLAARGPRAARAARARAVELRETLFVIFTAVAAGRPLPAEALARLNRALPPSLRQLRLVPGAHGTAWAWTHEQRLDRVLWPVVRAAALLLTSPDRERVRESVEVHLGSRVEARNLEGGTPHSRRKEFVKWLWSE